MKKVALLASILSLSMMYTSCKKVDRYIDPEDSTKIANKLLDKRGPLDTLSGTPNCDSLVVDFMAGQHTDIGSIVVKSDTANLYVTFNTVAGWTMKETHLYVGPLASMPQTPAGNPKIGNFPYKASHTPGATTYTYTIPRTTLATDSCIAIVPHAATQLLDANGKEFRGETAWGAGKQLNGSGSWAMYMTYCFCDGQTGGVEGNDTGNEGNGTEDDSTHTGGGIEGN